MSVKLREVDFLNLPMRLGGYLLSLGSGDVFSRRCERTTAFSEVWYVS